MSPAETSPGNPPPPPPEPSSPEPRLPEELASDLAACLAVEDDGRQELAVRIAASPAYRRSSVGPWLHQLDLWPALPPGRRDLRVPVGGGEVRPVLLRVPRGYTPSRPWPFIYLLHPSGATGPSFLSYLEQLLKERIEEFVVAAPTDYRQTGLDAPPPFTVDHPEIFETVRRAAHIDAERCYALGYSTGGYAAWAVALLHADLLAGAVALGSVFTVPPGEDGLWQEVLPNLAQVPVIHVWGDRDSMPVTAIGAPRSMGTMAEINERFRGWTRGMRLPIEDCRVPGRGHGGLVPPAASLTRLLAGRRARYPRQVDHTFRHVFQGQAYWLEAHSWEGEHWGPGFPRYQRRPGESDPQALGRAVADLLGRLRGEIDGQTVRLDRRHVGELTVWVGEGMIDWQRPVAIEVGGKRVFSGPLQPDLALCLAQAARTFDFDRLRWAGVRIDREGRAQPVTARTAFSPRLAKGAAAPPRREPAAGRPPRRRG
ncbi:MAG TPA: hypothetical protein VMM92_09380 [Thermoanaerobaculia bacterium]|nr:hypothetical protein [Thermoanaerobaculia bacterium]